MFAVPEMFCSGALSGAGDPMWKVYELSESLGCGNLRSLLLSWLLRRK